MDIGFTGTRKGMSDYQKSGLLWTLKLLVPSGAITIHHGDCVGADADAHKIVKRQNWPVVLHPPLHGGARAHCQGAVAAWQPKPYLARNRDIVNCCTVLVACPDSDLERRRSGTWATIRYARSQGKTVHIIYPSGQVATRP